MAEPTAESIEKAKNMAKNGIIHDNQFNVNMTVYEYAQHLDAMADANIKVRVQDLENDLKIYESKLEQEETDKLLKDPRVRKAFGLDKEG